MGKLSSLLWGAAIGAGLMYFYDPQNGNRRKAMIRDQVTGLQRRGDEALDIAVSDLRNRIKGVLAEGIAMISGEDVSDNVIEARAYSRMRFFTRHPGAMNISVRSGTALLSGDVLASDMESVMQGMRHIRGIQNVQNNLRVHQDASDIPQLQGEGWLPGQNGSWAPSTRFLVGTGALYLMLYGMVRGGLVGFFARLSGMALGTRALTNQSITKMTGIDLEGDAFQPQRTTHIHTPVVDEVMPVTGRGGRPGETHSEHQPGSMNPGQATPAAGSLKAKAASTTAVAHSKDEDGPAGPMIPPGR